MKTSLKTFPWGHGAPTTAEWAKNFRDELRKICDGCQHNAYIDGSSEQVPRACSLESCVRFHPKEILGDKKMTLCWWCLMKCGKTCFECRVVNHEEIVGESE